MLYPYIKKLYIYKPPNQYTLDVLINDRLWAAKPERFNDPFDCDLEIAKHFTEKDVLTAIHRKFGDENSQLPGPISCVILGIRIEGKFKSCIEKLCKDLSIPCVQARKADREFRIKVPT